jgi:hypothetical protein
LRPPPAPLEKVEAVAALNDPALWTATVVHNHADLTRNADELVAQWNEAHPDDPIEPWHRMLNGPPGWIWESSWLFVRIFGEDSGKFSEDSRIFGGYFETCAVAHAQPGQAFLLPARGYPYTLWVPAAGTRKFPG